MDKKIVAGVLYAIAGIAALFFTAQWVAPSGDSTGAIANAVMLAPGIVGILMAVFAFAAAVKPQLSKPFAATSLALLVLSAVALVAAMAYGSGMAAQGGREGDLGVSMEMVALLALLPGIIVYAIGTVLAWLPASTKKTESPIRKIEPVKCDEDDNTEEGTTEETCEIEEDVESAVEEAAETVEEIAEDIEETAEATVEEVADDATQTAEDIEETLEGGEDQPVEASTEQDA